MAHTSISGFYESASVAAFFLLAGIVLALMFKARQCYIAVQVRKLLAERADERVRIARVLHDTMLQGVQTLTLRFQYAARELAEGRAAGPLLNNALEAADRLLSEGRDRVTQLRQGAQQDLAEALAVVGKDQNWLHDVNFRITVEGSPRPLQYDCHEELFGIGREAITNAFRHARASRIECIIVYDAKDLRIICLDDGIGMQCCTPSQDEGKENWGTVGMKERAYLIDANLQISSKAGQGTEVRLSVPGRRAYHRNQKGLGSLLPWRIMGELKRAVFDLSKSI